MIFNFCAVTDTGRIRENNEDSVTYDESSGVAVLADGMGGYNAGEVASGIATASIKQELSRWLHGAGPENRPDDVRRAMEACIDNANLSIYNSANTIAQYAGMGTTLVVGAFCPAYVQVAHVGDSRCYRLRQGNLEQITRDHSLLQEQLDAGLITQEQAMYSNIKNLVTRALGVEDVVFPEISQFDVAPGDIYLMCSDGLSDMVCDADISQIVAMEAGLQRKAELLVEAANENGGRDNISVLLVEVREAAEKRGLIARWLGK